MTVTDVRPAPTAESTPESQDAANLRAMLDDPELAGWHGDIRESLAKLPATSVPVG